MLWENKAHCLVLIMFTWKVQELNNTSTFRNIDKITLFDASNSKSRETC